MSEEKDFIPGSSDAAPRGRPEGLNSAGLAAAIAELLSETEGFGDEQRAEILCAEAFRWLGSRHSDVAWSRPMREAIARIDAEDRSCPVRARGANPDRCSKCGATSSQSCGPNVRALAALEDTVRALLQNAQPAEAARERSEHSTAVTLSREEINTPSPLPEGLDLAELKRVAEDRICDVFDIEPDRPIVEQSNFGSDRPAREIVALCLAPLLHRLETAERERESLERIVDEFREDREQLLAGFGEKLAKAEADLSRALEGLRKIDQEIDNWFAPWGAWKTAWWEDFASDSHEYTADNFIRALRRLTLSKGGGNG